MPDQKLNTEGVDLSVFKKPTVKLNTDGVDLSVFKSKANPDTQNQLDAIAKYDQENKDNPYVDPKEITTASMQDSVDNANGKPTQPEKPVVEAKPTTQTFNPDLPNPLKDVYKPVTTHDNLGYVDPESIGKSRNPDQKSEGSSLNDFISSTGHNFQRVGAEISKAVVSDIKNPLFPGTYAISAAGTQIIDNWQKTIPKDADNMASKAGAMVPMIGMALATVFQPEIAPATTAAFFAMGQGEGLNHADEVEKDSKEPMPQWKKDAYGIGYGAAMSVPWGGMLGHLLPAPVKKYMVSQFMKASPELIDGLEGTLKSFADKTPRTGAEIALNVGKQYLTGVGKSAAGMEAMDLGKQATNKALGENIGMAQLIDGVKQSITSGAIFESFLFPFAKMEQNASIRQRREDQGTVSVGLVQGKPAEIYQSGKDYYGIRPDGTSVKANESDYNNSMIIPTDVFNKTIETGVVSPTIQRDVYSGRVTQMVNKISNEDGNIFVATDPQGNNYYATGRNKEGKLTGVNTNGDEGIIDPAWKAAMANKGSVYNSLMAKFDQPKQAPTQTADQPQQLTVDPRFIADQQARANIEVIKHTDGNVHTAYDAKGNEIGAIKSETPGGQSIVIGQDGKPKTIATADIKNRKVQTPDEAHAEQMQQYDIENEPEPPSTFNMNGKSYGIQDMKEDGTWLVHEVDDKGNPVDPTAQMQEIDRDTQKKILDQLQSKPQEEPKLNTIEVGKTQYTFTPGEDNSLKSEVYNNIEAADKAKKDIETVLGSKNDVEIVHTPNPDPMQPDDFHVSVTPKKETGTQENINLSEIFPENDQSVTTSPSGDNKTSEFDQLLNPKISTNKIGNSTITTEKHEGFDDVLPTEDMPLEKALPILQKKFKDHPKFVVQEETEKVEIPGKIIKGETEWDEDVTEPSTFKKVVKSIHIVPVAEVERQAKEKKATDTNDLLDLIDTHNATPASRENKETAKQITAKAKEIGYQTEKDANNNIKIFDQSGTIEREKPIKVEEKKNLKSEIKKEVPKTESEKTDNQLIESLFDKESEQKNKSEIENNKKSLQDGNSGGIKGTSGTGEPVTDGSGRNDLPAGTSQFDELFQSGNKPDILPGGSGKGNKGIGQGKHPKPKVKPNTIIGKAKEIEVSPTDLKDLALQYFINGGTVHPDEILKLYKGNKGEQSVRRSYTSKEDGLTIAQIAHNIEESLPETVKDGLSAMDVQNAVEDVINSHNSPSEMAKTLLKKYAEDENQGYSKEWLDQQLKKEDEERKTELEIWTNDIDQLEKTGELPTENELIELFKTNNDGQEINKEGDVGHDRPANPEGNVEDGEKLQADKPAVQYEAKEIKLALDKFDNDENFTFDDLINDIEPYAEGKLATAIIEYRKDQEYDRSVSGRGDMQSSQEKLESIIRDSITPNKEESQAKENKSFDFSETSKNDILDLLATSKDNDELKAIQSELKKRGPSFEPIKKGEPIELSKEELDKFDFKDEDISKAKKKCITLPKGGFKI